MSKPATKPLRVRAVTCGPALASGSQYFEKDKVVINVSTRDGLVALAERGNEYREALCDLLDIYDRHVHGKTKDGKASESWGIPEVLRLNEIRALAGVK